MSQDLNNIQVTVILFGLNPKSREYANLLLFPLKEPYFNWIRYIFLLVIQITENVLEAQTQYIVGLGCVLTITSRIEYHRVPILIRCDIPTPQITMKEAWLHLFHILEKHTHILQKFLTWNFSNQFVCNIKTFLRGHTIKTFVLFYFGLSFSPYLLYRDRYLDIVVVQVSADNLTYVHYKM